MVAERPYRPTEGAFGSAWGADRPLQSARSRDRLEEAQEISRRTTKMRMQVTLHRQSQARWSMTSHLQELGRRNPEKSRVLTETERAVPASGPVRAAVEDAQGGPPGR